MGIEDKKLYTKPLKLRLCLPQEGLRLRSGGVLPEVEVAYEVYGRLNADKSNAILICPPLTMDAHVAGRYNDQDQEAGWWDEIVGPGKAIDTDKFYVIGANILGGCRGTTGPASLNPATGKPYGSAFPRISIPDIVRVQSLLVEQLGIEHLAAVVGGSLGGMQALEWSIAYPDKVKKCICIAASTHLSPQALGFEVVGRKVVAGDKHFSGGDYYDKPRKPDTGLAFARMIGLLTYLSADSMSAKFRRERQEPADSDGFHTGYDVESYLDYNAQKFSERFDANSYLHITYAMDTYDLVEDHGSIEKAFKPSSAEFLIVALSSDWLFPPQESRALAEKLLRLGKIVSLVELNSPYGHDAFLLEVDYLSPVIESFLEGKPDLSRTDALKMLPEETNPPSKDPVLFSFSEELRYLESLIEPGSHILDLGCGDGNLINELYHSHRVTGFGVEIDLEHIIHCFYKNVPVVHGDVDQGLALFADKSFDYAVLNQTMQMLRRPQFVLNEMLRVAEKAVVVFPNFANIKNRMALALGGVMPLTDGLPYNWWESPNIHLFTFLDFQKLCGENGIRIEATVPLAQSRLSRMLLKCGRINLGAEFVIAKIGR